jgi:pyridinium-3,5-bisthiocarboxylic acid mononucleotide nickel chelatase
MHLHFDPVGGAAGDMFIAALLHAFPEHRDGLFAAIRAAGVPRAIGLRLLEHTDAAMSGLRFDVIETPPPVAAAPPPAAARTAYRPVGAKATQPTVTALLARLRHAHGHSHSASDRAHDDRHNNVHAHRQWSDIRAQLLSSPLPPPVLKHALGIFTLIAEAEAKIHGVTPAEVSFHEVGAWDSIADVAGAAFLIDAIGAQTYSCAPLPLGSGRVHTAHGELPVPVPAAAALLTGLATFDDGRAGERVTPTGAAILRYLNPAPGPGTAPRTLARSGTGFGTKRFAGISNVLRVLVFEEAEGAMTTEHVAQIEFDVDDQTPEDLAVGLDRLRALPGVLDVVQMPVFGKKGRIAAHVRVLAQPHALAEAVRACFSETTTIGLRHQSLQRTTLARRALVTQVSAQIGERDVAVKIVERPAGLSTEAEITGKAEMDAVAGAGDHAERQRLRESAVHKALTTKY